MKKLLMFAVLSTFFFAGASGQTEGTIQITDWDKSENQIEVHIKSDRKFVVGAQRYVLHIGDDHFVLSKHPNGDESKLVFLISEDMQPLLSDGDEITLVYGLYEQNKSNPPKFQGRHWNLGHYSPTNISNK